MYASGSYRSNRSIDPIDVLPDPAHGFHPSQPEALPPNPEEAALIRLKEQRAQRRRKRLIKRGIIAGVIVLVLVGIGVGYPLLTAKPEVAPEVITDMVVRGTFSNEVSSSGSVQPVSSVVVSPQIEGTIDEVKVAAGDTVAKGDVLFTIKNDALDRAVVEADRAVQSAQRELNAADKALRAARNAPSTPAMSGIGGSEGGEADAKGAPVSTASYEDQIDAAQNAYDNTLMALEAAKDTYTQAVATAELRTVTAPASGSLIAMNAVSGSSVGEAAASGAGQHLAQIADLTQMKVTVQISEVDIVKITVGQAATATFSAVPDIALNAEVISIASTTGSGESSLGPNAGGPGGNVTYAVELLIPEPDERLKPGMTASVTIVTESYDDVLLVPASALEPVDGSTYQLLIETDPETHAAEYRSVTVTAKNASQAAVEGNVKENDIIIVSGFPSAEGMEGMPVSDKDMAVAEGASSDAGAASVDAAVV